MSARRASLVSAYVLAVLLTAGCSSNSNAPAAAESPTPACDTSGVDLGVVVPAGVVTDEAGSYCHVAVDEAAVELTPYDQVQSASVVDSSGGISPNQEKPAVDAATVESAQRQAAKWLVEEHLDGATADHSAEAHTDWIRTTPLIGEQWREAYANAWAKGSSGGLFVPVGTPLVRDDRPRVTEVALTPTLTRVITNTASDAFVETCYAVKATYVTAEQGKLFLDSPGTCVTFAVEGSTVPFVVQGTHNSFTVTDENGAVIAQESDS